VSQSFRADLLRRTATAAVVLPALSYAIFRGPVWLWEALTGLCALIGLYEFGSLLEARGLKPFKLTGLLIGALAFFEVNHPGWWPASLWPAAALAILAAMLWRAGDLATTVPAAAGSLFGALWLGALMGTIAALRHLPSPELGAWRVILLLFIVMTGDSLAYFVGHAIGRHRLAPNLSPGKTVEGALGGLLGGVLGALIVRFLGFAALSPGEVVGLGVVVAAVGIAGDLAESLLKRWAGVKDSGTLIPGHGGVLDRSDSLLFGAPVLYYWFIFNR
jgi:phosphatidate cytidylyltransferase